MSIMLTNAAFINEKYSNTKIKSKLIWICCFGAQEICISIISAEHSCAAIFVETIFSGFLDEYKLFKVFIWNIFITL